MVELRRMGGSAPPLPSTSCREAKLERSDTHEVVLVLEPSHRCTHPDDTATVEANARAYPLHVECLSDVLLEDYLGPPQSAFAAVRAFADARGLEIVSESTSRHDVILRGSVEAIERAFGVELHRYGARKGRFFAHQHEIGLAPELDGIVSAVLGLDSLHRARPDVSPGVVAHAVDPREIAERYGLAPAARGAGSRVVILSFGGGFDDRDLAHQCRRFGVPVPDVTRVSVLGAPTAALDRSSMAEIVGLMNDQSLSFAQLLEKVGPEQAMKAAFTLETTMDVQIAAAVAPEAHLEVISAPNDSRGFYTAIHAAVGQADTSDVQVVSGATRLELPTIVAISWGEVERNWSTQGLNAIDHALRAAQLRNVTVCCSSGDKGAIGAPPPKAGGTANANFPASSPWALACGGTYLPRGEDPGAAHETVWNRTLHQAPQASGGGFSGYFERPSYQGEVPQSQSLQSKIWRSDARDTSHHPTRGLPDVSASADPEAGYAVVAGGVPTVGSGTSASTQLLAAMFACLRPADAARVGWLNALVYGHPDAWRDVTRGNNDTTQGRVQSFDAESGWDACTGLGTPDGTKLEALLRRAPG